MSSPKAHSKIAMGVREITNGSLGVAAEDAAGDTLNVPSKDVRRVTVATVRTKARSNRT